MSRHDNNYPNNAPKGAMDKYKKLATGNDFSDRYADCTGGFLRISSAVNKGASRVKFKAFLTDFNNSFSPNWQVEEVFGRNDPIGMFKGTRRSIALAWDVPSANENEAVKNKTRANSLAKLLYPAYLTRKADKSNNITELLPHQQTLAKPPLVRIRFANLIRGKNGGLLGWIDSCSISPNLDMGYFVKSKNLYPKVWKISINFSVLHEHDLGYNSADGRWFGGSFF